MNQVHQGYLSSFIIENKNKLLNYLNLRFKSIAKKGS